MSESILAAVDIGGTKVTASVSSKNGLLAKVYQPTVKRGDNASLPGQIDRMIDTVCQMAEVKKATIAALGISTCSPFERRNGKLVVVSPNLCGGLAKGRNVIPNNWTEIPMEEKLRLLYKGLRMGNDCITAVVAERLFGAGAGEDNLIYVTWSTGIGAGAYVDGRLLTGKNNNAMHLGHTFMTCDDENQPQCGCGGFGHLEAFVSGPSIARDYALLAGDDGLSTVEVFNLYREGNSNALKIIRRAALIFARGLANATALLDTRLIIVGGSVSKDWDVLKPLVEKEYYRAFPALTRGVEIKKSVLDHYLGDIAALSLVMPEDWIEEWHQSKPWERAPKAVKLAP